jgi:hypothetical protein
MASGPGLARRAGRAWRRLNFEQRSAGIGALLLLVSTFGPFSFVEAAEVVVAVGLLALLRARAEGMQFHLPFGDGVAVAVAGGWTGVLIMIRLFERPIGQSLLGLAAAGIILLAGLREHAKRPADDLPTQRLPEPGPEPSGSVRRGESPGGSGGESPGRSSP